jgi:hypothetical protein
MSYEKDIKDLIQQMAHQQSMGGYTPQKFGGPNLGTDQSPHLINQVNENMGNPDQSPPDAVNSVRPMGKPIAQTPRSQLPKAKIEGGCPYCGMIHPPLAQGQKCPVAPVSIKNEKGEEKEVDVNKFLASLKNIIVSQSEMKKVKDIEKLFKNIIVEITKYLEGYRE